MMGRIGPPGPPGVKVRMYIFALKCCYNISLCSSIIQGGRGVSGPQGIMGPPGPKVWCDKTFHRLKHESLLQNVGAKRPSRSKRSQRRTGKQGFSIFITSYSSPSCPSLPTEGCSKEPTAYLVPQVWRETKGRREILDLVARGERKVIRGNVECQETPVLT